MNEERCASSSACDYPYCALSVLLLRRATCPGTRAGKSALAQRVWAVDTAALY